MFWAAAACAAATAGGALVGPAVIAVVLLTTLVSVAVLVFRAAQSAVLPELVDDPADLTAANVLSSAAESVGLFAGPALAGLLLALHGSRLSFAVAAVLFASACAALTGTRVPRQSPRPAAETASRASTRELLRLPAARLLLLLALAQTTVGGGVVILSAALVVGPLDSSIGAVGALNSAFGLGCVVGSFGLFALAGSSRLGAWTSAALLLWGAPLLLVPLAPGLAVVVALLVLVGIGNVMFDVTAVTLLQRAVPRRLTGRAFGVLETVIVLGVTAGALVAPPLERLVGPAPAFLALGACLVLVSIAGLRPLRRLDRNLAAPARQIALLQRLAPFALLPTPEIEALALLLRRQEFASGDVVVRQGERGDTFFVVDTGDLGVAVDAREVATLGPGDSFGEIALLRDGSRTATVTARTPAVLWALEGSRFVSTLRGGDGRALAATDELVGALLQRARPGTDE
jgi:MFS family permease